MPYRRFFPRGISLSEVLISMVIIAIYAVAAYPSHTEHNRLSEATTTLTKLRETLKAYHQAEHSYLNSSTHRCVLNTVSTTFFDFSCSSASDHGFTITASNKPHLQLGSGGRFEFSIDQDGNRKTISFAGSLVNTDCWMTSRNGC